jgi:predicted transcriptional regulator
MAIELPGTVEQELRRLAAKRGMDISALLEAAVRQYLEAEAITDVDAGEIAEAQIVLVGELRDLPEWK